MARWQKGGQPGRQSAAGNKAAAAVTVSVLPGGGWQRRSRLAAPTCQRRLRQAAQPGHCCLPGENPALAGCDIDGPNPGIARRAAHRRNANHASSRLPGQCGWLPARPRPGPPPDQRGPPNPESHRTAPRLLRLPGQGQQVLPPHTRVNHRVRAATGKFFSAQVEHRMASDRWAVSRCHRDSRPPSPGVRRSSHSASCARVPPQ